MIGAAFVLLIAYLFLAQWIRITVFTVAALVWLNVVNIAGPAVSLLPATNTAAVTDYPVNTGHGDDTRRQSACGQWPTDQRQPHGLPGTVLPAGKSPGDHLPGSLTRRCPAV
ncbi:cellulose synthase operon protein YhjU [Serratia fonticola]|uniref:Cellulose synthase operon protein YhjU n=1 Tax=Serratia fonticola TaxID=47917 RepID=A0A4U9VT16_SERFO|nr:cellulose synthase operon protein YhjU [Serratia fonticola]